MWFRFRVRCGFGGAHLFVCLLLLSLLSRCSLAAADRVVQSLYGQVEAGNYSYYTLSKPGRVVLVLETLSGDADLYVSARHQKPTFELSAHEFQSTSCGVDIVHLSQSLARPIAIGVYGHPSHLLSSYRLAVALSYEPFSSAEEADSGYSQTNAPESDGDQSDGEQSSTFLELIGSLVSFLLQLLFEVLT